MKVLVSGANGQLGSELRMLSSDIIDNEFFFFTSAELDITDEHKLESVFDSIKPNFFINCAAYTAVDLAEDEVDKAYEVNDGAVGLIAENCLKHDCVLLHVSTDYVFDGKSKKPYLPEESTNPIGIYGASKLAGENKIRNSGCKGVIIRTAWVFSSFGKNFVKTMKKLGGERSSLNVVNDQIGAPTYARDLAMALLYMLESKYAPHGVETHHFTNEGVCSWADFAGEIMREANLNCEIHGITTDQYPTKAKRPSYSVLSLDSFKSTFPTIEIRSWQAALNDCLSRLI